MRLLEFGEAVVDGVVSIPTDLYYGARRTAEDIGFFGKNVQKENNEELKRIGNLIRDTIKNRNTIHRIVSLILDDFFENLPENVKDKILERADALKVMLGGRVGTQLALSNVMGTIIAKKITDRIIVQRIAKLGTGFVLSAVVIQGLIERSSNASKRLKVANPRLFNTLQKQNLDPLYFVVEEMLAPIVSAGVYKNLDYRKYSEIMEKIQAGIK